MQEVWVVFVSVSPYSNHPFFLFGGHLPLCTTSVISIAIVSCYGGWSQEIVLLPSPSIQGIVMGPMFVHLLTLDPEQEMQSQEECSIYSWQWHPVASSSGSSAIWCSVLPSGLQSPPPSILLISQAIQGFFEPATIFQKPPSAEVHQNSFQLLTTQNLD